MADTQTATAGPPRRTIDCDPFSFFPTRRSALGGLGGADGRADPTYVFHTDYQPSAPGRLTFSIRFHDLEVTKGTLVLRILAMPADKGAIEPTVVNTAQIALATVADREGRLSMEVRAAPGTTYALAAFLVEETDAMLSGVAITLDRLDHLDTDVSGMTESEDTAYAASDVLPIAMLLTSATPTLAAPVSQVMTPGQLDDPHAARWARALGGGGRGGEEAWGQVYVLRLLERYGLMQKGARGLLLGDPDEAMARALADAGCTLSVHAPAIGEGDGPPAIPEDLRGYDFLWTRGLCDRLASPAQGARFIEDALACLKIGGLAIHVLRFVAAAGGDGEDVPGALVYTRVHIERLAFQLITGNHEIAQLAYDLSTGVIPRPTRFGLAMRKGSF